MRVFACIAIAVFSWFFYQSRQSPLRHEPGVLVPGDPLQTEVTASDHAFDYKQFQIKPLAHFALDARVLHRKIYRYDRSATLVPVDLAVGWGRMSDQAVLDQMEISQSARFFWYQYSHAPPIPRAEIISHATNLHLIPATDALAAECKALRAGELIHLGGLLVEATGPEIGTWRSSLTRTDEGNGACELVWVEELRRLHSDR